MSHLQGRVCNVVGANQNLRRDQQPQPVGGSAAAAARRVYPQIKAVGVNGNVLSDIGMGYFRWADVVVGALDHREARVFVNQCSAQVGRKWIDGGIDVLNGIVRGFSPPESAC
jgi:adenylyltransferase/sulfurtransferase